MISVALPNVHAGALAWEKSVLEIDAEPTAKTAQVEFRFRNTSARTVIITSVAPNCDCTIAELAKRSYAPGETGEITAQFTFGERYGLQEKRIAVSTDESGGAQTDLILRVNIKDCVTLEPRWAVWHVRDKLVEKTILCTASTSRDVTLLAIESSNPGITARIETLEKGRKFLLHLRPTTTEKPLNALVTINTSIAEVGVRPYRVYAQIK